MRKVKWGVVGPGNIAADFVSDFKFLSNGEVFAVSSRSLDRAQTFANRFDIPNVYGDYESMLTNPEVEAVYVATPHSFHFEQTTLALKAGKAVLCEKPITTNPEDFESLRRLAKDQNQLLMEGMWTYFLPAIRQAKAWVEAGRIGNIKHVKSDFGFHALFDAKSRLFAPELGGGALLDVGIYPLALSHYFLENDPSDTRIRVRKAATGVDSDVAIWMDYSSGMASLHASIECHLPNKTYVIGDKGYIELPNAWQARECSLFMATEKVDYFSDNREGFGFNFECEAFNDDLIAGRLESEVVSHEVSAVLQRRMADVFVLMNQS